MPLKLPEAIASAKTQKDLEEVAQLGPGNLMHCFGKEAVLNQ